MAGLRLDFMDIREISTPSLAAAFSLLDCYTRFWQRHVGNDGWWLLGLLLLLLLIERGKHLYRSGHRWTSGRFGFLFSAAGRWGPGAHASILLGFALAVMARGYGRLSEQVERLEQRLEQGLRAAPPGAAVPGPQPSDGPLPVPFRPRHPKRLGGVYYRGNDERAPELFNGGFYRTATFHLSLCGDDARPVSLGQDVAGQELFVRLEIERAPQTASELFDQGTMESIFLSRQVVADGKQPGQDVPVPFTVLEQDRRWAASYPIGRLARSGRQSLEGFVYVYQGQVSEGVIEGNLHYGIRYDLVIDEGRLSRESDLWMGSLYQVGGLVIPPPGTIPLSEWFDFRPIPEIEGENSKDPRLLGIAQPAEVSPPGAAD